MSADESVDTPPKMLCTHLVVHAFANPLEHGPDTIDSNGTGHRLDEFTCGMLDLLKREVLLFVAATYIAVDR